MSYLVELFVLILFVLIPGTDSKDYKRLCYFTSWSQYRPKPFNFEPQDIDPFLCTHIVYAFLQIRENTIITQDWRDEEFFKKLVKLKDRNPSLKLVISVGGYNEGSDNFSELVSNSSSMEALGRNSIQFLRSRNLDGLDIDWEYPADRGSPPEDKQRFSELLRVLREAFNAESVESGLTRLLLGVAVKGHGQVADDAYDVVEMSRHLDFIMVMSYDYHVSADVTVGVHSALYGGSRQPTSNVNASISFWLSRGAPSELLVLGVPMYARHFVLTNSSDYHIGAGMSGPADPAPYTREAGVLAFYEVCAALNDCYKEVWRSEMRAAYAYKDSLWMGFDNVRSIEAKAAFIKASDLAGYMTWEISLDDFRGSCGLGASPLLNTMKRNLLRP